MSPDDAVRVLQFYFSYICQTAGIHWNSDMDAEVEDIVDYILSEPRHQINGLLIYTAQLEDRIKNLDEKYRFHEVMLEQHADQFHRLVELVDGTDPKSHLQRLNKLEAQLNNLSDEVSYLVPGDYKVLGDYKKE